MGKTEENKNVTDNKVIDGDFKEINTPADQEQGEQTPETAEEAKKDGFFKKCWKKTKKAAPYVAGAAAAVFVVVKIVKAIHSGDAAEAVEVVKEAVPAITENSQALIQTTVEATKEAVPEVVTEVTE